MWNIIRQNRLVDEKQKIKDHSMHIERLRNVKASIDLKKMVPQKPQHILINYKKEQLVQDKKNEIQYENRLLLKKMLQIDLKPSKLNKKSMRENAVGPKMQRNASLGAGSQQSQGGLNSYNSLNRAVRIKNMAKIVEDNRLILKKLQTASSFYSIDKWEQDNKHKKRLIQMICKNSDRYCKNPYFLHSLATTASDATFYNANMPYNIDRHNQTHSSAMKKRSSFGTLDPVAQSQQLVYPSTSTTQNITRLQSRGGRRMRPMSAPKYGEFQGLRAKSSQMQFRMSRDSAPQQESLNQQTIQGMHPSAATIEFPPQSDYQHQPISINVGSEPEASQTQQVESSSQ